MSEFGAEGHFVVVRQWNLRKSREQWHFRWVSNHRVICASEKYSSEENTLAGIRTLPGGAAWLESKTPLYVDLRFGKRTTDAAPLDADPTWVNQSDVEPE